MHDVLSLALEDVAEEDQSRVSCTALLRASGETVGSDVDLMVVGKVDFGTVVSKLANAQKALNREINPTVFSVQRVSVETPR